MSKNFERIFLSFLLSFAGSIIARQLGALWWAGLIAGFVTGYIGYDVRGLIRAIPIAFSRASDRPVSSVKIKDWIANLAHCTFYTFGAGASAIFTACTLISLFALGTSGFYDILPWIGITSLLSSVALIFVSWSTASNPEHRALHVAFMSHGILWLHPITFALRTVPIFIFHVLQAIAWVTEEGSELACCFIRQLFLLVHSHKRVLFGIDVAIGVAIGHYTNNAILGGLAGMAWWIFDWHVVSLRYLKLEEAK